MEDFTAGEDAILLTGEMAEGWRTFSDLIDDAWVGITNDAGEASCQVRFEGVTAFADVLDAIVVV